MRARNRIVSLPSVAAAQDHGIAVIYQERAVVPELTVAQNIMLGHEPTYRLPGLIDRGAQRHKAEQIWALLGLTIAGRDIPALSQADVDGLATWLALKAVVGEEGAFGLLRVLGAAMARLAEAESTMIRSGMPDIHVTHTHDELATAQAYRAAAAFIPRLGLLMDTVHRHHLISARTHFEVVMRDTSANVTCGVGFADLSGFTVLTQALTPAAVDFQAFCSGSLCDATDYATLTNGDTDLASSVDGPNDGGGGAALCGR